MTALLEEPFIMPLILLALIGGVVVFLGALIALEEFSRWLWRKLH